MNFHSTNSPVERISKGRIKENRQTSQRGNKQSFPFSKRRFFFAFTKGSNSGENVRIYIGAVLDDAGDALGNSGRLLSAARTVSFYDPSESGQLGGKRGFDGRMTSYLYGL